MYSSRFHTNMTRHVTRMLRRVPKGPATAFAGPETQCVATLDQGPFSEGVNVRCPHAASRVIAGEPLCGICARRNVNLVVD